jgi:RNA polymerase sigma-70 factor (ECF subfamily)
LLDIQQPKAYLTTTAKRILIDRARHQKIEQAYLEYLTQQNLSYDISPEQTVLAIDILNKLAQVLDGLPERQQLAFLCITLMI